MYESIRSKKKDFGPGFEVDSPRPMRHVRFLSGPETYQHIKNLVLVILALSQIVLLAYGLQYDSGFLTWLAIANGAYFFWKLSKLDV